MRKQIKLSSGIVAFAIVLLSCLHVHAQATVGSPASNNEAKQEALKKENAIKATSTVEQNNSSEQNFKTTQGSIQLSPAAEEELARLNNVLAITKSKWEDVRNQRELTPAETVEYNSILADIESQIKSINATAKIKSTK
jgi:hypothetical protein